MFANPKRFTYGLLSKVRLLLAFGVLALFFCVYISPLQKWSALRAILAYLQFSGALVLGTLYCLVLLAVAAIAGRWYCSALCPLGTLQEAVWTAGRLLTGRRTRFVSPWRLRYAVPALAGIVIVTMNQFLLMDPISNFGRGVRSAYILVTEGVVSMTPITWAMLGMFVFILTLAAAVGRRFCDWCPVGILLGVFASAAPLGVRLRKDYCVSCGNCEKNCPMNCVDSKGKVLDNSRCVLCLRCASVCPTGALEYGTVSPVEKAERREFLRKSGKNFVFLGYLASAFYLGGVLVRRVFPDWVRGKNTSGSIPIIMPPGARNVDNFFANCVGCLACVAACPAKIIRAADSPHPRLDYTNNYCQYNCTECSDVCPSGALVSLRNLKQRTRIGLSALDRTKCVVITRGEACGACAEVCAPRALRMEPLNPGSPLTAPVLDSEYCIGCGGCFHVCPAEPRAFEVTGVTPQVLTPGIRPSDPEDDDAGQGIPVLGDDEFPF